MNNPESFVLEPAVAPISLVAQMQEIIEEQERTIKSMAMQIAWFYMVEIFSPARLNSLDTAVDFE